MRGPQDDAPLRRYVAHSQAQLDGRMITDYRGDRYWSTALADVRRVQGELLLELGRLWWQADARPWAAGSALSAFTADGA